MNGKLMPYYDILIGAKTVEGDSHLAERIGTVPAKKIPDLLAEASNNGRIEKECIKTLIAQYDGTSEVPDKYYYDWGADVPFSLAGRGPGECGTGVMDVIKLDIEESKHAINNDENIYKAVVSAARALLIIFGLESKKDYEIFAAFKQHIIEPGWIKPETEQLLDDVFDKKMENSSSINDLLPQVRELVYRVEELFLSLDAGLKFKAEPIVQKTTVITEEVKSHVIDLRGVACPLNFVKAKLELEKLNTGDILDILLDEGESVQNVPASFVEQNQDVLEVRGVDDYYHVKVRRKK